MSNSSGFIRSIALMGVALTLSAPVIGAEEVTLKTGDEAPAFTLKGSDGQTHSLADHRGKSAVVLAWFPKAFTGG